MLQPLKDLLDRRCEWSKPKTPHKLKWALFTSVQLPGHWTAHCNLCSVPYLHRGLQLSPSDLLRSEIKIVPEDDVEAGFEDGTCNNQSSVQHHSRAAKICFPQTHGVPRHCNFELAESINNNYLLTFSLSQPHYTPYCTHPYNQHAIRMQYAHAHCGDEIGMLWSVPLIP